VQFSDNPLLSATCLRYSTSSNNFTYSDIVPVRIEFKNRGTYPIKLGFALGPNSSQLNTFNTTQNRKIKETLVQDLFVPVGYMD
jgi:hypothetical protein